MSNGTPPVQPAPVPPSIAGIPQPVFAGGSATIPATPIPITGSPILPPPLITNPPGTPVFPPAGAGTAPVPVPVGPLVGPAVPAATVPPSVAGFPQPQYVPPGSATVPTAASLFPSFTAAGAAPPILINARQNTNTPVWVTPPPLPLPTTPGIQPIIISPVPTIPQMPWNPPATQPPPANTVRPLITVVTDLTVGSTLGLSNGTWTNAATYARVWLRDGSPIAGASASTYVLVAADVGFLISGIVTATGPGGEASAESLPVGPVVDVEEPPLDDEPLQRPTRSHHAQAKPHKRR